jgi:hypothetical protein
MKKAGSFTAPRFRLVSQVPIEPARGVRSMGEMAFLFAIGGLQVNAKKHGHRHRHVHVHAHHLGNRNIHRSPAPFRKISINILSLLV